jgi:hypothetical protein
VIDAFESGTLALRDFYFTGNDYRYRFEVEPKQRFIEVLRQRFNSGVNYKGRILKWGTVIEEKTGELARFVTGKTSTVDSDEPSPNLEGYGNRELRERINSLTSDEAKRLGIGKSTLHYLRKKARSPKPFTVYATVRGRLAS